MIDWWISLARRYLKLPEGDPKLPGDPKTNKTWNPDEKYLHYSLLGFYIGAFFAVPVSFILFLVSVLLFPEMEKEMTTAGALLVCLGLVMVSLFILVSMAVSYAIIHIELDMLRYTLTDNVVRLRRGVMKVEEVTLSYVNIQNVKFSQGPLQRYFGIADLIVETAGGGQALNPQQGAGVQHHQGLIKGVSRPEALRDLILKRVQEAKGAGLGDDSREEDDDEAPPGASVMSSREGQALLREIRDSLKVVNSSFRKK
ncbi:MAG: PH domain-containing protein [Planctomycetota bacterium]|nr:PH domain-containing protein [Planctomycetota bacterium]